MSTAPIPSPKAQILGELILRQIQFNRAILTGLTHLAAGEKVEPRQLVPLHDMVDELQTRFLKLLPLLSTDEGTD